MVPSGQGLGRSDEGRAADFLARLRETAGDASELGRWFAVVAVRPAGGDDFVPLLLHLERLVREYDAVLATGRLALVLLPDTDDASARAFVEALALSAPCRHEPGTEYRCFAPGLADGDAAERWVRARLQSAPLADPSRLGRRSRHLLA